MNAPVAGILNVDKPAGMTSHAVVGRVRLLTGMRRVGHSGTLDPLATGVLLLCLGRATRLAEYVMALNKTYEATVRLGQETNTYDADGQVVANRPVTAGEDEVSAALERFRGPISQIPPMFSAIKKGGQPLYKLARRGEEVDRPPRQVTVYELSLLAWRSPDLQLRITCSSGTYVRAIAHDLGQALGCGGHVVAMRRTAVGHFKEEQAIPLNALSQDNWQEQLRPIDSAVMHLPRLVLEVDEATKLYYGQHVACQENQLEDALFRAYDEDGRFVGVVSSAAGVWKAQKIFYRPQECGSQEPVV